MTKTGSGQWCSVARIAGGLLAGLLAARASAAQKVWTGGGTDNNLSTPANWEGGAGTSRAGPVLPCLQREGRACRGRTLLSPLPTPPTHTRAR